MPYLHLDLPGTYPVQVKRELATRLCERYAEVMEPIGREIRLVHELERHACLDQRVIHAQHVVFGAVARRKSDWR